MEFQYGSKYSMAIAIASFMNQIICDESPNSCTQKIYCLCEKMVGK
jgi:hypothetical protein